MQKLRLAPAALPLACSLVCACSAAVAQTTPAAEVVVTGSPRAQKVLDAPFAINGFEGEIVEAMRCIRAGLCESPVMPHSETLATLAWMDRLRSSLGVRYPGE